MTGWKITTSRRQIRPTLAALVLSLGLAFDALAATATVQYRFVTLGAQIHIFGGTEIGSYPTSYAGTESLGTIAISGPCGGTWHGGFYPPHHDPAGYSSIFHYGYSFELLYPSTEWVTPTSNIPGCDPAFYPTFARAGEYMVTVHYGRSLDEAGQSTVQGRFDFPITVLSEAELRLTPTTIPVGGAVQIEVLGPSAFNYVDSLIVSCPAGGTDSLPGTPLGEPISTAWPSFAGGCDSSMPGVYSVALVTDDSSATKTFRVIDDRDSDGVWDLTDNCINEPNPLQENADGDDAGDACDSDDDNDGIRDEADNCPSDENVSQDDLDGDGEGDVCDLDPDGDGVVNGEDNCPYHPNPTQEYICEGRPDDQDLDGVNDAIDNCPEHFNPGQQDHDGDGIGSRCDDDIDGDLLPNDVEADAGTDPLTSNQFGTEPTVWDDEGTKVEDGEDTEVGDRVTFVFPRPPGQTYFNVTVTNPGNQPHSDKWIVSNDPYVIVIVLPIWEGVWRVRIASVTGSIMHSEVGVIPEPGGAVAGYVALLAIAVLRGARRRCFRSSASARQAAMAEVPALGSGTISVPPFSLSTP